MGSVGYPSNSHSEYGKISISLTVLNLRFLGLFSTDIELLNFGRIAIKIEGESGTILCAFGMESP
jgi:hypothetical protein